MFVPACTLPPAGTDTGSETLATGFTTDYKVWRLPAITGQVSGQNRWGGIQIDSTDPNIFYVVDNPESGGGGELSATTLLSVKVVRDSCKHVTAWAGAANIVAYIPYADASLIQGPDNTLLFTQWSTDNNKDHISQLASWSSAEPSSTTWSTDMSPLGVDGSGNGIDSSLGGNGTTGLAWIPYGFATAGSLRTMTWGAEFYAVPFTTDSSTGQLTFGNVGTKVAQLANGPGGMVYVPKDSPMFLSTRQLLVMEYNTSTVAAYPTDANGTPNYDDRLVIVNNANGVWGGGFVDPLTGDVYWTGYNGDPHVHVISGFALPECATDTSCHSSQWCNTSTGHCTADLANGTAIPAAHGTCGGSDGSAGSAIDTCQSGACNAVGNACAGPASTLCSNNNQCTTNACVDGTCSATSPPSTTVAFGASSILQLGSTTLTITITNTNTSSFGAVGFTDSLPSGLAIANSPSLDNTCGGTVTAVAGATTITLSGGSVGAASSCVVSVQVTGSAAGTVTNSVSVTDAVAGTGATASATLIVVAPPIISKWFGAAYSALTMPINGTMPMNIIITNTNPNTTLTNVGVVDNFPDGLVVANPNRFSGLCGNTNGTLDAASNSNVITLSGVTLAPNAPCSFWLNVLATSAGVKVNTTNAVTSDNGGTGTTASSTVLVLAPPTLTQSFTPAQIAVNGNTTLTYVITNPSINGTTLRSVGFSNTLPAGLAVTNPNGVSNTCGGTVTAVANSNTVSLSGATLAQNTNCVLSVQVTATVGGTYDNSVTSVTSSNGGMGNGSTGTLTVAGPPTLSVAYDANVIAVNGTTTLSLNLSNASAENMSGVNLNGSLPTGLLIATPGSATNTCGGTLAAVDGSNTIALSGAALAAETSCVITVQILGTADGYYVHGFTPGSNEAGAGSTVNVSIAVVGPPQIAIAFEDDSIPLQGNTTLTFTVTNPTSTDVTLLDVGFTNVLPSGLTIGDPNGLSGACGRGTITAAPGSSEITVSGAAIPGNPPFKRVYPVGCVFSIQVVGTMPGTQVDTTLAVTSSNGGTGNTGTATVSVLAPPTVNVAFSPATVAPGVTSALSFTISNPAVNPLALNGITLNNTLPSGLVVATPNGIVGSCPDGSISATAGATTIVLEGGILDNGASCSFAVNVVTDVPGFYFDTTDAPTSDNGGTGLGAYASLTVVAPPTITASFEESSVPLGGSSWFGMTLGNPQDSVDLTNVGVTSELPCGLVVATPSELSTSCGAGVVTADANSRTITVSGVVLTASEECTVSMKVTGVRAGAQVFETGNVAANESGTGTTATATLNVVAPPAVEKSFGDASVDINGWTTVTLTVSNPDGNPLALNNINLVDVMPNGLMAADPSFRKNGQCAEVSIEPNSVTMSISSLDIGTSCPLTFDVQALVYGQITNTTQAAMSDNGGTGNVGTAVLNVPGPDLAVTSAHGGDFTQGQTGVSYSITVSNMGTGTSTQLVTLTDTLPAGLTATSIVGDGWTCNLSTLTCSRSDHLGIEESYPAIVITVNVAADAAASVNNVATVNSVADVNNEDNTSTDVTHIVQLSDLVITPALTAGASRSMPHRVTGTLTVNNVGLGVTSDAVLVNIAVPDVFVLTSLEGDGWSCASADLQCERTDVLQPGASYPPIMVTADANSTTVGTYSFSVGVSGGGELNTSNDAVVVTVKLRVEVAKATITVEGSGQGCQSTQAVASAWVAALLFLWRRRARPWLQDKCAALGCVVVLILASAAHAGEPGFSLNPLPAPDAGSKWAFADSLVPHGHMSAALIAQRPLALRLDLNWAGDPLVVRMNNGAFVANIVHNQFIGTVGAGFYVLPQLRLNVNIPVALFADGDTVSGTDVIVASPQHAASLGDVRVAATYIAAVSSDDAVHLGVTGRVQLPSGSQSSYMGDDTVSGTLRVTAAGEHAHVSWAAGMGARGMRKSHFLNIALGSEAEAQAALGWHDAARAWLVGVECLAATVLTDGQAFTSMGTAVEPAVSGHWWPHANVGIHAAVSRNLTSALGGPSWRALVAAECWPWEREPPPPPVVENIPPPPPVVEPPPAAPPPEPDSDADGLADNVDKCPSQAGLATLQGCPEVKEEKVKIEHGKLSIAGKIFFETAKDVIRSDSFSILDEVASVLKQHPELTLLRVEGHTDNQGNAAANLSLSGRRAEAVRCYLTEHGVEEKRLQAQGFGQTKPIASNATADGRTQNRRVEFVILEPH